MNKQNEQFTMNRLGDTGFRMKNQVSLYSDVLKVIYDNKDKNKNELWGEIKNNLNDSFSHKKRKIKDECSMLCKLLCEFNILNYKKRDKKYVFTSIGETFFGFESKLPQHLKTFKDSLFFFWRLLNWKKEKGYPVRQFIEQIVYKETLNSIIDKWTLGGIKQPSINLPISINDDFIKSFLKPRKPSKPKVYKTISDIIVFATNFTSNTNVSIGILDDWKIGLGTSYGKGFLDVLIANGNKKTIRSNKVSKVNSINNYFYTLLEKGGKSTIQRRLLDDLWLGWKKKLIKDYNDINCRWFVKIGLIYRDGKNYRFNKNLNKFCLSLIKRFKSFKTEEISLEHFISCLKKISTFLPFSVSKYPVDFMKTIQILRSWKDQGLPKDFENIKRPTVIEFLVNVLFGQCLGVNIKDFITSSRTLLDANLFPTNHAPGGGSDAIFKIKIDGVDYVLLIETTIQKSRVVEHEFFPCLRHYVDEFKKEHVNNTILLLIAEKFTKVDKDFFLKKSGYEDIQCNLKLLTFKELIDLVDDYVEDNKKTIKSDKLKEFIKEAATININMCT